VACHRAVSSGRLDAGVRSIAQLWRGDLTAEDDQALWNMLRVGHGTLRLPDGREGVFTAVRVEGLAGEQLRINGSGHAPF